MRIGIHIGIPYVSSSVAAISLNPILTVDEAYHFTTVDGNFYFTTYTP